MSVWWKIRNRNIILNCMFESNPKPNPDLPLLTGHVHAVLHVQRKSIPTLVWVFGFFLWFGTRSIINWSHFRVGVWYFGYSAGDWIGWRSTFWRLLILDHWLDHFHERKLFCSIVAELRMRTDTNFIWTSSPFQNLL